MSHRGPDDSGTWFGPGVGLCHRRLSIIDLSSTGHQPMWDAEKRFVIVFNGEIYNYRELRAELEAIGTRFCGHSDTEVVLGLYARYGDAMLTRLNGIFAFALWDVSRRRLVIARDALGVKPLYYCADHHGLAFASEIKALLELRPDLATMSQINGLALARYMSYLYCPGDATPLNGVHKLSPGEAIAIEPGGALRRWLWYRLPAARGVAVDDAMTGEEAIDSVRRGLRDAVVAQMVADVPVGAFLSGGLDSSAIVAFAKEMDPRIRCFSIDIVGGQEQGVANDLPYARRVASHLGVDLEVVSVDAQRFASGLAQMVAQLDEPLADPAPLHVLFISQLARDHGIKVLLSGAGGDDLFTGYRRHRALVAERYWDWAPRSIRSVAARSASLLDQRRPWARRLSKALAAADQEPDVRLAHYFQWAEPSSLAALLVPSLRDNIGSSQVDEPIMTYLQQLPASLSRLARMLALEQRFFLADHNLIYTDKMSMAAGVEARVPFLDPRLVELAARIPARFKVRRGTTKWVLKRALEPYLPGDVIYRPKTGFGAPLRRWLRCELRDLRNELLAPRVLAERGLFEPRAVQQLIADDESGRVDLSYSILSVMNIELWCRAFIDRRPTLIS